MRAFCLFAALVLAAVTAAGQSAPPVPLRLVSVDGQRNIPTVVSGDTELVAIDDLAQIFGVQVREDALAKAITIEYQGRTVVLSQDQALASISGRLVSLPAAPSRVGNRWHVPVEIISRAIAPIYGTPLDLRKASRLVIRGPLRVPRIVVRHEAAGSQARVTLDVFPRTAQTVVQEGNRLAVRFEADLLDAAIPAVPPQGLVQAVRVDGTSVMIEPGPRFGSFRSSESALAPDGARVTVDLFAAPETTEAAPPSPPGVPGVPGAEGTTPPPPIVNRVRTIVIDPGHGGDESGAQGARGTLEKAVTLGVARQLKGLLESRLGARVLMTREDDRTLGLDQRAAVANNNKADLFISLHANASLRGGAAGAEVFYLSLDEEGERARREAASQAAAMPVFGGGTRDIDIILWEMAQARHVTDSAELAQVVEQELRGSIPMSPTPIQAAPFRVLVGANMPAVVVELGYLTNAQQEQQLANGDFQQRAAQALASAVARFFAGRPADAPPVASAAPATGGAQ
jgi:N-acetylmuramoyl-L-alanine amidase